ncbi:hypothetical protein AVEN_133563-1 [Araneus ventricosus]|uniref:DUF4817 domain-containing protein n=1 Tax=Araneus ventricosus TaxID=182803 RepID=A0A4Y2I861_ARAVE|nr:hypothetical protein AVEN_133563-1 [Araneus ventricosus]
MKVAQKFFQIGNVPLGRTKSAAAGDSQRKCQNGYREAEGKSGTSLVPQKQQRRFRLMYRNCQSPNKDSVKRWYEKLKGTVNEHHKKGAGRPSVSDQVVQEVRETFTP